jgi:D-3-phosphoglycerate dehydrogenase / 2-oxoglutarate reductase
VHYYIIDFDSTFTKVEALDELAAIALQQHPQQQQVVQQIQDITLQAMAGTLPFDQALQQRLQLLNANTSHITVLIDKLKLLITDSFVRNAEFIKQNAQHIYIVSGGFKEYILPIVTPLGILPHQVFANTFITDIQGNIIGHDANNLLAQHQGKVKLLQQLNLQGHISVIGDGFTDYELKQAGLADAFYLFIENVNRDGLVPLADHVINSLDEFLNTQALSKNLSYPKHRIKVLLLENVHPNAITLFTQEGYQIETIKGALDEQALAEKITDIHILGIRSKTQVTEAVLANAKNLMAIGAYCIGTNQINLEACAQKGIVVFNAPYSNTRSVVELALGEMIVLMRNTFTKSNQMHNGVWDKSAINSFEIRAKILGIVGYGNIGSQLSVLAEALGMQVYFYDVADKLALGNARKCNSLHELLSIADVVTIHVDGREQNTNMIAQAEFAAMKPNVIFMNLSRGHVVHLDALQQAINTAKVWGCAVDVYPYEPASNNEEFINPLRSLPNTILTPHIGGSTEEAQANIGEFVPYKIMNYINNGDTYGSVNFPEVQLPNLQKAHRFLHIHHNTPGILAQINNVFAQYKINIAAQYLKTNNTIGYVITDVAKGYDTRITQALKAIPGTIRFRMLY